MYSFMDHVYRKVPRPFSIIKNGTLLSYVADKSAEARIPEGVEFIAAEIFDWRQLPDDVVDISELKTPQTIFQVYIPASVKEIDEAAFFGVLGLKEFVLASDCTAGVVVDGMLYDSDKTTLLCCPTELACDVYVIPEGVKRIGRGAFGGYKRQHLGKVCLPATITSIGEYAFLNCVELTIEAPVGSFAIDYAKENGIDYIELAICTDQLPVAQYWIACKHGANLFRMKKYGFEHKWNSYLLYSEDKKLSNDSLVTIGITGACVQFGKLKEEFERNTARVRDSIENGVKVLDLPEKL